MKQIICLTLNVLLIFTGCKNPPKNSADSIKDPVDTTEFRVGVPVGNDTMRPEQTEYYSPVPSKVTPGKTDNDPPSDAIVLFDGQDLDNWVSVDDTTMPAQWIINNSSFTIKPGTGDIRTKQRFKDYQLHLEWREPTIDTIQHKKQVYGNSGVFLASLGKGNAGYELQILDSYNSRTYVNGQCGSLYKQYPPLVNTSRPPEQWQTYDIIWHVPRFNADSSLKSPAVVTVFQNGILIQDYSALKGVTLYVGHPYYVKHGPSPIKLQDHHDKVSFRNIWIRRLK